VPSVVSDTIPLISAKNNARIMFFSLLYILAFCFNYSQAQDHGGTSMWPTSACTEKSLNIPSWLVSGVTLTSTLPAGNLSTSNSAPETNATAVFSLRNRVHNKQLYLSCSVDRDACIHPSSGPLPTVRIRVRNDTFQISITAHWTCSDKPNARHEAAMLAFLTPSKKNIVS
jgi:hypothetical protein